MQEQCRGRSQNVAMNVLRVSQKMRGGEGYGRGTSLGGSIGETRLDRSSFLKGFIGPRLAGVLSGWLLLAVLRRLNVGAAESILRSSLLVTDSTDAFVSGMH